jgi:hypothetical protein
MATLTIYPDASTGATTCDAPIQTAAEASWAAARGASSGTAYPNDSNTFVMQIFQNDLGDVFRIIRSIFTFDTSVGGTNPLSGATINSATFSIYGTSKADAAGYAYDTCVVGATPAANNSIANGDFDQLGTTLYSSVKTYADFSTTGYNDYTLNATGIAAIATTGITALGIRNKNYDIDNVSPGLGPEQGTAERTDIYFADQTGTTNDPKLVIDYTAAATTFIPIVSII